MFARRRPACQLEENFKGTTQKISQSEENSQTMQRKIYELFEIWELISISS
jgi:hypothetical protein